MNMELDFIKEMFDSIAPKYDFLNRFLSLRQDVMWRRQMVKAGTIPHGGVVLDVACGTCDVALEIKKQKGDQVTISGTDFSPGMLLLGKQKILSRCGTMDIELTAGNALALPFKDNCLDALFIAFGIRNIMDREGALVDFHRVLKKNGKVVILELSAPRQGSLQRLYMTYFQKILPFIGGLFSKNKNAYHYLPASVLKFPGAGNFANSMEKAGFNNIQWKKMTLGIVTLFVGTK
ncbi:demethylmenaquinone methyltransferase / 2-methoxy-6-polyprenyl-1,4-benzoquinol methylase [Desulfocicer vacuolatum DSM 3385]|uniref:Demethylmenaquinone methyltransferase n=1 Tax=Desulfocicer vacuolatum DSM 3385 TaxID=1121400 RepID=A0A1W1ZTB7_9BACT|nr:bifunctional demethylmenaquinone methyltransferase/2-methoxy-6-polyprenyl-1,4-benzoquinol methylase UbiE [Desulfocicer vacuolatum]SMC51627.1 demethylmenaquinone methyltransferase / 2-methoxy-6-polyprenyl-1,4-benzoquinol methylase [Desulfocicer vacuolatum DSM 3385]